MAERPLIQDATTNGEARANQFPQYLMKLLNEDTTPESLYWLPDGLAFALDPEKVTEQVLDKHFQKTKYSSFIRRLHNEGFRRQTRKYKKMTDVKLPDGTVVLSHDMFQRDKPELLGSFYKNTADNKAAALSAASNSTGKEGAPSATLISTSNLLAHEAKAKMQAHRRQLQQNTNAAALYGLATGGTAGVTFNPALLRGGGCGGGGGGLGHFPAALPSAFLAGIDTRRQLSQSIGELRQAYNTSPNTLSASNLPTSPGQNTRVGSPGAYNAAGLMDPQRQFLLQQQMSQQFATLGGNAEDKSKISGMDQSEAANRLHQLELDNIRRRWQLEQQQQLSAANALRRFQQQGGGGGFGH